MTERIAPPDFPEQEIPEQEAEDIPEHEEDVVDAEFRVKKKPLRYRLFPWTDPERKAQKGKVVLWTIDRTEVSWEPFVEYRARKKYVLKTDLPRTAKHQTGMKNQVYVDVDMEPIYPDYADPDAERDEEGNFVGPHNYFDAFGYFKWFVDQRIKKGYDALGVLEGAKKPLDWKTIGMVAIAAVVVIAVFMSFYG